MDIADVETVLSDVGTFGSWGFPRGLGETSMIQTNSPY